MTTENNPTLTRRKVLRAGAATGALLTIPASAAASESQPYTDIQGNPGPGEVTLTFINNTDYRYVFDHRADGESPAGTFDFSDDTISEGPCKGRKWGPYYNLTSVEANSTEQVTVEAAHKVEAQAVLGPEQNYYTCWKTFYPEQPDMKSDCKRGGWEDYHFENQGQCIRYVTTGEDRR